MSSNNLHVSWENEHHIHLSLYVTPSRVWRHAISFPTSTTTINISTRQHRKRVVAFIVIPMTTFNNYTISWPQIQKHKIEKEFIFPFRLILPSLPTSFHPKKKGKKKTNHFPYSHYHQHRVATQILIHNKTKEESNRPFA